MLRKLRKISLVWLFSLIAFSLFWLSFGGSLIAQTNQNPANQEIFFTNKKPTQGPFDRYRQNTKEHFLRRSDVTFFISIPFTLLWSTILTDRFKDLSVIGAYFEGERGSDLRSGNFNYSHDTFPTLVDDPIYVFKWVNASLWPLAIVVNDFIERSSTPERKEELKENLKDNRFDLDLIHQPSF